MEIYRVGDGRSYYWVLHQFENEEAKDWIFTSIKVAAPCGIPFSTC
jgi:hypothetical protein